MQIATTLLVTALTSITSVNAWGRLGHQTVALLAQQYLLPKTISAVQELLNDTTPIYVGRNALWPDDFAHTPEGQFSAQFHYIDGLDAPPPESCVVKFSDCPEGGCVMTAIANYTARVQDKSLDLVQRQQALYFIVHFLGDIAQPLHSEGVDIGGNSITVTFNGFKTNLHSVWDTAIPNSIFGLAPNANISFVDSFGFANKLSAAINKGEYKKSVQSWVKNYDVHSLKKVETVTTEWANESNKYVCSYVLKDGDAAVNNTDVGGAYAVGAYPIVEESIARAGIRLSAWLNLIFAGNTGF